MHRYVPYILKTLWRHRTRTLLTVSGAAVAMFVFSFVGAVQEGLDRLIQAEQQDRTLVVFQANRFCPSTSKLPEDYALEIRRMPGVKDAVPIKVYMNNCRASLDVVVFNGLPAEKLRTARALQLQQGDWTQFERQQDAALVGQAIARRRGLSVGDKFSLGELTVTVGGVFQSSTAAEEGMIYTHLDFLQRTRGLHSVGTVTQMEVQLDEQADAGAVSESIDARFRAGPVATHTRTKGAYQARTVGDLIDLVSYIRYLGYACAAMVLGLVATTTVMGVQDRIREHALLQTLGFTGWHVFAFVVAESLIVSLTGGLIGIGGALATLHWSQLSLGAEGILVAFLPSRDLAIAGFAASAAIGLLAGALPAWQASRAEIVPALKSD